MEKRRKAFRDGGGSACGQQHGPLHYAGRQRRALHGDMEVTATGQWNLPCRWETRTLGRLFNVLGDTLDGGESLEG